jgi:hypothetical protein
MDAPHADERARSSQYRVNECYHAGCAKNSGEQSVVVSYSGSAEKARKHTEQDRFREGVHRPSRRFVGLGLLFCHRRFPYSSSASRRIAGAAGFFTLIQSGHLVGPGR